MKNQNIKINPKYKLMALLSLLLATGCAHKNIVKDARFNGLKLQDMKTGKERIYDCSEYPAMQDVLVWLSEGDTVSLKAYGYLFGKFFTPEKSNLSCNYIELQRRKNEFEEAKLRYEIQMNYPKENSAKK